MCKGLGGWQRLGIVLAIVWTIGVAGFVWTRWPKLIAVGHLPSDDVQYPPTDGKVHDWVAVPPDSAEFEILEQRSAAWSEFQSQRSEVIRDGSVLWLVPLFAAAAVASAGRWVYRGFRPLDESAATSRKATATGQHVVVVAYALFMALMALFMVVSALRGTRPLLTSVAQAALWVATAVALFRNDRMAPTLLWWLVVLSGLGILVRGLIIPSEIVAFGLTVWFAVWYQRAVKPETPNAQFPDQQRSRT